MGDGKKTPLKLWFDSKVRLDFRGATITSDTGRLVSGELDVLTAQVPIAGLAGVHHQTPASFMALGSA